MKTSWLIAIIVVIAAAVLGIAVIWKRPVTGGQTVSVRAISENDRVEGDRNASIILIEYSDFQCPACAAYFPVLKLLRRELGGKIAFAYRHFPLSQHANAEIAARAAEAAGRQEKFWEMHDIIFERQAEWAEQGNGRGALIGYADALGLDRARFTADLDSKDIRDKVANDFAGGLGAGVNSTPTFFLNGKKIKNPQTYDEFKNIIAAAENEAVK